ncbi:MAG: hypothetical protein KC931_11565 [Candidatus Omnitrophica bacterium]|nr:hypothetical protein [Candidatus Omnitrophota bacterium]
MGRPIRFRRLDALSTLHSQGRFVPFLTLFLVIFSSISPSLAMVGGKTYVDGPFLVDDVEDFNLVSETLGRDWIPDYDGKDPILSAIDLSSVGLTLAVGQSENAAFAVKPTSKSGFVNQGFGVPVPGEVGQSTLDFPGDITSFPALNFLIAHEASHLTSIQFQVLLECYPENDGGGFPTLFWNYSVIEGTEFTQVSLDLSAPSGIIDNDNSLSVETLLSQTRFLFFFFSAVDAGPNPIWDVYLDDINLGDTERDPSSVLNWEL